MTTNIWDVPSIDEYWDNLLRGKEKAEQEKLIEGQTGTMKEYLLQKIKYGIGNPVIVWVGQRSKKNSIYDVRDFETYCRVKKLINKL